MSTKLEVFSNQLSRSDSVYPLFIISIRVHDWIQSRIHMFQINKLAIINKYNIVVLSVLFDICIIRLG